MNLRSLLVKVRPSFDRNVFKYHYILETHGCKITWLTHIGTARRCSGDRIFVEEERALLDAVK